MLNVSRAITGISAFGVLEVWATTTTTTSTFEVGSPLEGVATLQRALYLHIRKTAGATDFYHGVRRAGRVRGRFYCQLSKPVNSKSFNQVAASVLWTLKLGGGCRRSASPVLLQDRPSACGILDENDVVFRATHMCEDAPIRLAKRTPQLFVNVIPTLLLHSNLILHSHAAPSNIYELWRNSKA